MNASMNESEDNNWNNLIQRKDESREEIELIELVSSDEDEYQRESLKSLSTTKYQVIELSSNSE